MRSKKAKQYAAHHSSVLQMGGFALESDNVTMVRARSTKNIAKSSGGQLVGYKQKYTYCKKKQVHATKRCPAKNETCFV